MDGKSEENAMFEKFANELYEGFPVQQKQKEFKSLEIQDIPRDISPVSTTMSVSSNFNVDVIYIESWILTPSFI